MVILMGLDVGEVGRDIPGAQGKQELVDVIVDSASWGAERAAERAVGGEAGNAREIGERIREVRKRRASEPQGEPGQMGSRNSDRKKEGKGSRLRSQDQVFP